MSYGDTIKRLLGMHRVDQAELASWLDISPQTMTAIVKDQTDARISTYDRIFEFFGVEPTKDFEVVLFLATEGRYRRTEERIAQRRANG